MKERNILIFWLLWAIIIFLLWLWSYFSIQYFVPKSPDWTINSWTFWDTFGAINALFSWFAFLGVIITILLQKEDLKMTQKELKKSAEAQEKQVKIQSYIAQLNAYWYLIQSKATLETKESPKNPQDYIASMSDISNFPYSSIKELDKDLVWKINGTLKKLEEEME